MVKWRLNHNKYHISAYDMVIRLCQWRASIGSWFGGTLNIRTTINCTSSINLLVVSSPWFELLVVAMLLLIAGVESNPGPRQDGASQSHYKKTRGCANMSGELYEVKMSALLFLRGFRNQKELRIASNMDAAGCYDDIVMTLGHKMAFIQLKHREKQQSKIYTSQLIQFKGDFSLFKYCKSYLDIKKHWNQDKDLQFCGRFEDCIFIVFTNASLVEGVGSNVGSVEMHNIINTDGKCICFTEKVDVDIYKTFENLSRYELVLTEAIGCEKMADTSELLEIIKKLHNNSAKQIPSKAELSKLLRDLQSLGDLSGYREFLSQLCFYTEQKSEKDLNDLIRIEIINICGTDAVFDKFLSEIQNWWKNTNLYLTEHTNFWQEILMSCVANICKQIVDPGVRFNESECDDLRTKLSSSGRMLHWKTSCVQLSSLKVSQSLGIKLVIDVSMLETRLNEVLAVWKLGTLGNVLMVKGFTDCQDVVTGINGVLDGYSDKRLIMVVETDTACDDIFSLNQLDQESQDRILDHKVTFQGLPVNLRDLADRVTLLEAVTADIVMQLLSDSDVTVGNKAVELDPSYITRTLLRKECVSKAIFTDEDVRLAVSGISIDEMQELVPSSENVQIYHKNMFMPGNGSRFFIIEEAADFAAVCKFIGSVHGIHKQNKHFVWKSSCGDLTPIKKYLEEKTVSYSTLEKILKLPQQLFLVFGEPGIGKSTEMTHLNELLKQTDPSMWVVRVDLNDYTQYFTKQQPDPILLLMTAGKFVNTFEKRLLQHQVNCGGKITIIFDGFDEISPKYSEKVIAILKDLLGRNINRIWVTSRFLIKEDLEKEFGSLAFKFQHFTSSDENEFLLKFWKMPDSNLHSLDNFITKLLEVTRRSLNDKLVKLTGVPLHMKMLAEVFETEALHYCKTGEIDLPLKLDLLTLYNRFIDIKWEVYYSKINVDVTKVGLAEDYEEIRDMFQKKLMNSALVTLLGNEELKVLHNSEKIISKNREFLGKFKAGRERTGLVIDVLEDTAVFIHKTFAEYFVALWFSQNFSFNMEYFRSLYVKKEFQISRNFFDRILARHCDMHIAVLNQDKEFLRMFSEENCKVNEMDNGGRTSLHLAIANYIDVRNGKDYDLGYIIKVLLNHGVDCSVQDKVFCWTPLRLAEEVGAWPAVGLLLERKADPKDLVVIPQNIENNKFVQNVLRLAAVRGYVNLIKFILRCGVNVEHCITVGKDKTNNATLLHIAAAHKQFKLVKFLVEQKADVEAGDVFMKTPLMWAAECGDIKMVKLLLNLGAKIDARDRLERTSFFYAVLNNKFKIMQVFKQYDYDNTVSDIYGNNTLHYAATSGCVDWVECLVGCGIDVDSKNVADFTPLMLASMNGRLKFAEILLMQGAGVNICKETGETAILYAAYYGHFEVVKLLHEHGGDISICNKQGSTILHAAASSGNLECVKYITDCKLCVNCRNNSDETPLLLAARDGKVKVVDYLIEEGADINAKKKGGNTALHEASKGGNVDCVAYFLNCGLDVDCKNDRNLTPLWIAAESGKLRVVTLLLEHGADVGVQDKTGNTVLHAAASEGQLHVVEWLVKNGIKITACNSVGNTALQVAEKSVSCCLSSDAEIKFLAVIEFLRKAEEEESLY